MSKAYYLIDFKKKFKIKKECLKEIFKNILPLIKKDL